MASRLGPAQPRGTAWKGAGAWVTLSQARQEKRSRTVWITVHWRGTTSSVSVTSSPIFDRRMSPQHGQAVGAGTTTRTRGSWAGKGWREGFRRSAGAGTAALAAAFSAASASAAAEASSSSSCSSYWSRRRWVRSERWP